MATCNHVFVLKTVYAKEKRPVTQIACRHCKLSYEDHPQSEEEHVHIYEEEGNRLICCVMNGDKACNHVIKKTDRSS